MKYYKMYMDGQEVSPELHARLLSLEGERRPAPVRSAPWVRWGAMAACCALVAGLGLWRYAQPAPAVREDPAGDGSQGVQSVQPEPPLTQGEGFVIAGPEGSAGECWEYGPSAGDGSGSAGGCWVNFFAVPYINYQNVDGKLALDGTPSLEMMEGSFSEPLTLEEIQEIFWGAGGKPEGAEGDLPWTLSWEGYTVKGSALYDKGGDLLWVTLEGEGGDRRFTLTLRPGELPFNCCLYSDLETSDVYGTPVTGWSWSWDLDGDGTEETWECVSEFMAGETGVRFSVQVPGNQAARDGAVFLNSLLVRRTLSQDGGVYLNHLLTAAQVPAWREAEFSSLAQARQEEDFTPYLPEKDFTGYGEFYGRMTYQEGSEHTLYLRWSWGYDDVSIRVELPEGETVWGNVVSVDEPETYDLRLYPIPRADSVPEAYRETVDNPVFRAGEMSREVVEARAYTPSERGDTNSLRIDFSVLHPDGALVEYSCEGLTVEQVWEMVERTLK